MKYGEDFYDVEPCSDSSFECEGWTEYTYRRPGHGRGYFWQRNADGVRLFFRPAGRYYRDGEAYQSIRAPKDPIDCLTYEHGPGDVYSSLADGLTGSWPFGPYAPKAFDIAGAAREDNKKADFPDQMRVYSRDGDLLLFFEDWDGMPLSHYQGANADIDTRHIAPWLEIVLPVNSEGSRKVAGGRGAVE